MSDAANRIGTEDLLAHAAFLRGLARRLLRDEDAAEDVVQDAMVAALERPPRRAGNVRAWLATVVRNLSLRHRRGEARRRRRLDGLDAPAAPSSPAETVARLETQRRLVDAVLDLDEPYRTTVVMRFYEDRGPTEIDPEDGGFVLERLSPGIYALVVEVPGRAPTLFADGRRLGIIDAGFALEEGQSLDEVRLELSPVREVTFEVTDAATGEPVRGVRFSAAADLDRFAFPTELPARPAGDGRYAIDLPFETHVWKRDGRETRREALESVEVRLAREGFATLHLSFSGFAPGHVFEVELGRPGKVLGTIRGEDGRPAGNAVIRVEDDISGQVVRSAVTDEAGRYEIARLPTNVSLMLHAYTPTLRHVIGVAPLRLRAGEERRLDIGGGSATSIHGRILVLGRPVKGTLVRAYRDPQTRATVFAGDDGAFRFDGLPPGRYELLANPSAGELELILTHRVELVAGQSLRVDLDAKHRIEGTVVDASTGEPLAGSDIEVGARPARETDLLVDTDIRPDGGFVLHVPHAGSWEIVCESESAWTALETPVVEVSAESGASGVRFVLHPDAEDGEIEIRVLDDESGEPLIEGDYRHFHKRTQGAGWFDDGAVRDETCGLGHHHFVVGSRRHLPRNLDIVLTTDRKRVVETVRLERSEAVEIFEVLPGRAADRAGLRPGDLIVEHGGRPVRNLPDLRDASAASSPDSTVTVVVVRSGSRISPTLAGGRLGVRVRNARLTSR